VRTSSVAELFGQAFLLLGVALFQLWPSASAVMAAKLKCGSTLASISSISFARLPRADLLVLGDEIDHVERHALHQLIGRYFLRPHGRCTDQDSAKKRCGLRRPAAPAAKK